LLQYDNQIEKDEFIICEKKSQYQIDLRKRLFEFAVGSMKFIGTIPYKKEFDVLRYQFSKCSTSIGANYEESQSSSLKEFIQRLRICLREANECKYWLKIMDELNLGNLEQRNHLLSESNEIALIFGSIVSKLDRKIKS
jgi:four helix bundle protein